jgi:sodium/bile acid cotransporter 7
VLLFLISGLTLKTRELKDAILSWKYTGLIQLFNLGFFPVFGFAIVKLIQAVSNYNSKLLDGLIIMTAVPTTTNMCVVLTKNAKGNEAAALFNSTIGNMIGVFITPLWLLLFIHNQGGISFADAILSLVYKVCDFIEHVSFVNLAVADR